MENKMENKMTNAMTPWGIAQTRQEVAEGINIYSTASHGGIHLSTERWNQFKKRFPHFESWAGNHWLEEDCDMICAAAAFPEEFKAAGLGHWLVDIEETIASRKDCRS